MENKMDKELTFDIDDIEKVNLLIGKTDPRIEKVLKQFAGDNKNLLEVFKLKTKILLEFNKPFWTQQSKQPTLQKQPKNESTIYLKRKRNEPNEYWIFMAKSADQVEKNGRHPIFYRALAHYVPNTENGPCISRLEIYPNPTTGIGYWGEDVKEAPQEAVVLFKVACLKEEINTLVKEESTKKAKETIMDVKLQTLRTAISAIKGSVCVKTMTEGMWVFDLVDLDFKKVGERHLPVIVFGRAMLVKPDGTVNPYQTANTTGIGAWRNVRPATEEEEALFYKTFPSCLPTKD